MDDKNLDIMICAARNYSIGEEFTDSRSIYIYKTIYDTLDENSSVFLEDKQAYTLTKKTVQFANITFLNNFSADINGGYYRLDNRKSDEKIFQPPNPERAGHNFTGWFTEPSCVNIWDFNNQAEITDDSEFRLYAGWQQK